MTIIILASPSVDFETILASSVCNMPHTALLTDANGTSRPFIRIPMAPTPLLTTPCASRCVYSSHSTVLSTRRHPVFGHWLSVLFYIIRFNVKKHTHDTSYAIRRESMREENAELFPR
ncbi:unnamed protein product [Laminaria digitata]